MLRLPRPPRTSGIPWRRRRETVRTLAPLEGDELLHSLARSSCVFMERDRARARLTGGGRAVLMARVRVLCDDVLWV